MKISSIICIVFIECYFKLTRRKPTMTYIDTNKHGYHYAFCEVGCGHDDAISIASQWFGEGATVSMVAISAASKKIFTGETL